MRYAVAAFTLGIALLLMGASLSPVGKTFDASSSADVIQFSNVAATDTTSFSYELLKPGNNAVKPTRVWVHAVTDATFVAMTVAVADTDTTWSAVPATADSVQTIYAGSARWFNTSDVHAFRFKSGTGVAVAE